MNRDPRRRFFRPILEPFKERNFQFGEETGKKCFDAEKDLRGNLKMFEKFVEFGLFVHRRPSSHGFSESKGKALWLASIF